MTSVGVLAIPTDPVAVVFAVMANYLGCQGSSNSTPFAPWAVAG